MLLSKALFLASAATAAMAYQLDRRQSDQNIPDGESFCECIDKDRLSDDTLTQAVCRQYPNGDFAVFESGRVGLNLVGAVSKILPAFFSFSPSSSSDEDEEWSSSKKGVLTD